MRKPLHGPFDPGQSLADHGAGVVHRSWRLLYCTRHTTEFLDREPVGEEASYCPLCFADGDYLPLQELGVVVLPFFETNSERPE